MYSNDDSFSSLRSSNSLSLFVIEVNQHTFDYKTIYSRSSSDMNSDFLEYVTNLPFTNVEITQNICFNAIQSVFKGLHYYLKYFSYQSSNMPNFKTICIILFHLDINIINNIIHLYRQKLQEITLSLYNKVHQHCETNNNEIRKSFQICNLFDDQLQANIDNFYNSLPFNSTTTFLNSYGTFQNSSQYVHFGFRQYSELVSDILSENYENELYQLRNYLNNSVFYYCAFTLLSGQTLVIRSLNTKSALSLAKRFSIFVPFYEPKLLKVIQQPTALECMKYSIVVCEQVIDQNSGVISILDLKSEVYKGDGCPSMSFIRKSLEHIWQSFQNNFPNASNYNSNGNNNNQSSQVQTEESNQLSEAGFVLNCHAIIQKYASSFWIKLSEIQEILTLDESNVDKCISDFLKNSKLTNEDEPIFKYWVYAWMNKQDVKLILTGNQSKFGLTIATF